MDSKENEKKLISRNKLTANILLILFVTGLTLFYCLKSNIFDDLGSLKGLSWTTFLIIPVSVAVYILADILVIYRSIMHFEPKFTFGDAVGIWFYGSLGSCVTPGKMGHYPFKAWFMEKKGNSVFQSLTSMTETQTVASLTYIIIYIIMLFVCSFTHMTFTVNGFTFSMIWVLVLGLLLQSISVGVFLLLAFCYPFENLVVKILAKIKFFHKNADEREEFIEKEKEKITKHGNDAVALLKNWKHLLPSIGIYLIFILVNNCLPYVIYLLLSHDRFTMENLFTYFCLYQVMAYFVSFIPTPGNSGAAESGFVLVFGALMGNYLGSVLLLWRFMTFYCVMLLDFAYFIVTAILRSRKTVDESA